LKKIARKITILSSFLLAYIFLKRLYILDVQSLHRTLFDAKAAVSSCVSDYALNTRKAWRDRARSETPCADKHLPYSRWRCGKNGVRIRLPSATEQGQAGHHTQNL
jgi:hypothetical protein